MGPCLEQLQGKSSPVKPVRQRQSRKATADYGDIDVHVSL
ncbi:hypothetical protein roselon_03499 [Roseibacterium elongatum DSM 19469]|uniref:Uncharacterized protein n=1 Tax=Roseicyclus elongatus DSM 19469 TaxID=1294273 RepID=W8RX15_9RHOB|nr:hypothetical protein roselon_03499 [Roseibacterium elongatum DSM 19469]